MRSALSSETENEDVAVRRQLLELALHNARRSVPMLLVAVVVIVLWGNDADRSTAAAAVGIIGMLAAVWRLDITRRYGLTATLTHALLKQAQRELEGNAVCAGAMWIIATAFIYPALQGTTATTYVAMTFGSLTVAAFFMPLVGRAYALLVACQLGALLAVSVVDGRVQSWSLAIMVVVFAVAVQPGARKFRETTADAIRHQLRAESANVQMQHAKEAAEAAGLAKSQFLAIMSHEIRTPMNGVLGALELLGRSTLDQGQRRLVNTAASSGEMLMRILNDVLDHSKIEADRLELVPAEWSLHAIAASVAALLGSNAQAKGLMLHVDVAQCAADSVICDGQRLKQVLLNLVGNAIKFTEHGSVTLRLASVDADDDTHARIEFAVVDTGVGISEDARKQLFQPFHQIDGSLHRRRGGTGLGLAISQSLVEAMGGRIEIASALGRGSSFSFTLALERSAVQQTHDVMPDSTIGELTGRVFSASRVLLVEDNPVNLLIASEMLRSCGVDAMQAENGAVAVDMVRSERVDLVLMDCQMPVMDGYAAAQHIRAREARLGLQRVPIVAMTANAFDEDIGRAYDAGMDAHLAKPYTRAQLRAVLERWV